MSQRYSGEEHNMWTVDLYALNHFITSAPRRCPTNTWYYLKKRQFGRDSFLIKTFNFEIYLRTERSLTCINSADS